MNMGDYTLLLWSDKSDPTKKSHPISPLNSYVIRSNKFTPIPNHLNLIKILLPKSLKLVYKYSLKQVYVQEHKHILILQLTSALR